MFESIVGPALRYLPLVLLGSLLFMSQVDCAVAAPTSQPTAPAANESGPLRVLTRATAQKATTADLAKHLLSPGQAVRISSHELIEPHVSGQPLRAVKFFGEPEPFGKDLCVRDTFFVELDPVVGSNAEIESVDVPVRRKRVTERKQIALAPACRMQPNSLFASVQYHASFEDAVYALRRIAEFQRAAKAGEAIPVVICSANTAGNDCRDPRTDLSRLPLDRIFAIQRYPPTVTGYPSLDLLVMPDGPGRPYWEVQIEEQSGKSVAVELNWTMPPPF